MSKVIKLRYSDLENSISINEAPAPPNPKTAVDTIKAIFGVGIKKGVRKISPRKPHIKI